VRPWPAGVYWQSSARRTALVHALDTTWPKGRSALGKSQYVPSSASGGVSSSEATGGPRPGAHAAAAERRQRPSASSLNARIRCRPPPCSPRALDNSCHRRLRHRRSLRARSWQPRRAHPHRRFPPSRAIDGFPAGQGQRNPEQHPCAFAHCPHAIGTSAAIREQWNTSDAELTRACRSVARCTSPLASPGLEPMAVSVLSYMSCKSDAPVVPRLNGAWRRVAPQATLEAHRRGLERHSDQYPCPTNAAAPGAPEPHPLAKIFPSSSGGTTSSWA
jgi:hypothetical protein